MPKKRVPRVRQLGLSTRAQPLLEVSPTVNVTPEVNVTEEITSNPTFQVYPSIINDPTIEINPTVESNPTVSVAAPEVSVELSPTFQVDIPDTWVSAVATVSVGARGLQSIPIAFKSTTAIYVNPGAIHIWDSTGETILYNSSQLSFDLTSRAANTWYYIYVQRPSAGTTISVSDISYSTSAPSESLTKLGWYDSTGQKRCIGFIRTNSGTEVSGFIWKGGVWSIKSGSVERILNAVTLTTSPTTATLDIPFSNVLVQGHYLLVYGSGSDSLTIYSADVSGYYGGIGFGRVTSSSPNCYDSFWCPISSAKQLKIQSHGNYSSVVYVDWTAFTVPAAIYTGPSGGLERDVQGAVQRVDYGKKVGLKLSYASTSSFYVDGGVIHVNDGSNDLILYTPSQLTKSVSGLSASTWYAVYVDPPDTGTLLVAADIEYSSTMPTWDHQKCGWYHPTTTDWRCIGIILSTGSGTVMPFQIDNGVWKGVNGYLSILYNATRSTTDGVAITAGVPSCARQALVNWIVLNDNNWNVLDIKASDQTYYNYYGFVQAPSATRNYGVDLVSLSSSGQFTAAFENAYSAGLVIYLMGFTIPPGM